MSDRESFLMMAHRTRLTPIAMVLGTVAWIYFGIDYAMLSKSVISLMISTLSFGVVGVAVMMIMVKPYHRHFGYGIAYRAGLKESWISRLNASGYSLSRVESILRTKAYDDGGKVESSSYFRKRRRELRKTMKSMGSTKYDEHLVAWALLASRIPESVEKIGVDEIVKAVLAEPAKRSHLELDKRVKAALIRHEYGIDTELFGSLEDGALGLRVATL
jgi:hypothetical protein